MNELETTNYVNQAYEISCSRYSMPIRYRRLIHVMMTHAQLSKGGMIEQEFKVGDLVKILSAYDRGGKAYEDVKLEEFSDELMKQLIRIPDGKGGFSKWTWVDHCRYDTEREVFTIRLSSDLMPLILNYKKRFTRITFEAVSKIRKKHAWRFYEILSTEQFNCGRRGNKKGEFWKYMTITEIRMLLDIGENEYEKTSDFRIRVIEEPIKEINELDIGFTVEIEPKRVGKCLEGFKFICTKTGGTEGNEEEKEPELDDADEKRFDELVEELLAKEPLLLNLPFLDQLKERKIIMDKAREMLKKEKVETV